MLTDDATARASFEVQGKVPLLATRVDDVEIGLRASAALERARLWPAAAAPADIQPAKMFANPANLNQEKGDRKSVGKGKIVSARVVQGCRRSVEKKKTQT